MGAEDERGGEAGAVREDEQAAVEALPKFHATARVGTAAGQLYPAGAEADGVVVGDAARVPTAQPGGEIARGRAPGPRPRATPPAGRACGRSEEHTSELPPLRHLACPPL